MFGLAWRSRRSFQQYLWIEFQLLKKEWKILLPCVIMQYVHAIFHNLAYWVQANKLTTAQRVTLRDVGFIVFPALTGDWTHVSEILVFGAVFAPIILLCLTIPILRQNPDKPRYIIIIVKRILLHISIALIFRIISFLITSLPSPADHCKLDFDPVCLQSNQLNPLNCVINNPDFKPPTTSQFFTHIDAINGCGDLMFSSHTIYTLSLILAMLKWWWNKWFAMVLVVLQLVIAFFIIASHKHYSLDVFTALYVVPLLWFAHEAYYRDINHKDAGISVKNMKRFYDIDIREEFDGEEVNTASMDATSLQVTLMESGGGPTTETEGNAGSNSTAAYERSGSM